MSDQFSHPTEALGARYAAVVAEQVPVYRAFQPSTDNTYFHYGKRIFRSGDVELTASPLGSFGTDGSWLWAWANEYTAPPGSPERELSLRLRAIGERIGSPELVTPRLELAGHGNPRIMAERLAYLAVGALGLPGYEVTVVPSGARQFTLIDDESVPRARFPDITLVFGRIMAGCEVFPVLPHDTVLGYLVHHGLQIVHQEPLGIVAQRGGDEFRFRFDGSGRITATSFGKISPPSVSAGR